MCACSFPVESCDTSNTKYQLPVYYFHDIHSLIMEVISIQKSEYFPKTLFQLVCRSLVDT